MGTRVTMSTAVRRLIDEEDSSNSHFTDSEIYDYINQGLRYLGTDIEWPLQSSEATTVLNQATYELPDDFISLIDIYFNNSNLAIIERADLPGLRNDWQNADAGTPLYAYKSDNKKVGLFPKPDATNAGLAIQIQYIKVPADLAADSDTPDVHQAFCDCIPFYSSALCEAKIGNIKKAESNMALYENHKKRLLSKVQRFSDDLIRFRWAHPRSY